MSSGKRKIADILIESALIVFGILLGLYLQGLATKRDTNSKKQLALSRIITEISHNKDVVAEALQRHMHIVDRVNNADSMREYLTQNPFDVRRVLHAQPLYKVYPRATSWNAAAASGIVSEFDFTSLELLTDNYALQQKVIDQVDIVADIILTSTTKDSNITLRNLSMNMQELAGRERLLLMNYERILQQIPSDGNQAMD